MHFERPVAAFLRRVRMSPSEFGERAVGDRSFLGAVRRGRLPRLATADRVLAFMEAFGRSRESGWFPGFINQRRRYERMTSTTERKRLLRVRFLRLPEVLERTGLSRSTIYVRLEQGRFPTPVSLGARAVGWIESEVDEWMRQRIEESRDGAA